MWVPYPLVSLVTRLPQTIYGSSPLTIRTRTFETCTLSFKSEKDIIDVFESVKELTVATSINQLYAFFYAPNPPFAVNNGWSLYSPREEFGRMGVGTRTKAWRFSDINKDYTFSPTYPARMVVPTKISDATLQYASKYRSKCRIPVLTYLHWANFGSITRSSQPMVGLTSNRSIQDEKLIEAIFQTHHSPESRASVAPVYGATATNLIVDARPTANAVANTARGAGTENMDHYKEAKKAYLGIDHIHTMRESLAKVVEALRETEIVAANVSGNVPGESLPVPILDRQALRRSGWLRHIAAILEGSILIIRNVHINSSHVLIHCSDGWDRTSQLSSLAQICLDPYYRTMKGFQILVEKDWLSFGHKFLDRCGHLSSEKFFLSTSENNPNASGAEAFFASVQNKFVSQSHVKETSPVFHQFLESLRQVQRQYPNRFEYNERFLRQLHYHLYSCQFGTFLCNTERERRLGDGGPAPCDATISVWDFFNSPPEIELNKNPDYDPSLDDPTTRVPGSDMGVLIPNAKDVRFWHELYGRTDEEMNGKFVTRQVAQDPEFVAPIDNPEDDPAIQVSASASPATPASIPLPPSPSRTPVPTPTTSTMPIVSRIALDKAVASPSSSRPATPQRTRHESLRPFDSGSMYSSYTLKTQGSHVPPRTPSPSLGRNSSMRQPNSPLGATGGFFGSGTDGVRSVWGKLSSNASAAFSAVQDAAKDFTALSLAQNADTPTSGGGELKSKDEINAWGEERSSSPKPAGSTYTIGSTNPWNTSTPRQTLPSMFLDNPWGASGTNSVRSTSSATTTGQTTSTRSENPWRTTSTSQVSTDPSVLSSSPNPLTSQSPWSKPSSEPASLADPLISPWTRTRSPEPPLPEVPPPPPPKKAPPVEAIVEPPAAIKQSSSSSSDPLGVGFM